MSPYAINSRQGLRISVNDGYLEAARGRANLTIVGNAAFEFMQYGLPGDTPVPSYYIQ